MQLLHGLPWSVRQLCPSRNGGVRGDSAVFSIRPTFRFFVMAEWNHDEISGRLTCLLNVSDPTAVGEEIDGGLHPYYPG
jgi:hypothetical protein